MSYTMTHTLSLSLSSESSLSLSSLSLSLSLVSSLVWLFSGARRWPVCGGGRARVLVCVCVCNEVRTLPKGIRSLFLKRTINSTIIIMCVCVLACVRLRGRSLKTMPTPATCPSALDWVLLSLGLNGGGETWGPATRGFSARAAPLPGREPSGEKSVCAQHMSMSMTPSPPLPPVPKPGLPNAVGRAAPTSKSSRRVRVRV